MRRRWTITLAGGALLVAACGSPATDGHDAGPTATSENAPATTPAPTTSAAPDGQESSADEPTVTPATSATQPTEPAAAEPTGSTDATEDETAPVTAPTTEPPVEARPDDGCSADNTPTETNVADGPLPTLEVRAASAANPLPDLAVRRINCAGGWVNLKNEIPAELPLLVWFWAPH